MRSYSRRLLRAAPVLTLLSSVFAALPAQASDADEDRTCFPLYRAAGAIPGQGLQCQLDASAADVGMGTFFCTGTPEIIERYCGTVLKGGSCSGGPKIGNPIDSSNGNKEATETDYVGVGQFPLKMVRYYGSSSSVAPGKAMGDLWRFTYDRSVGAPNASLAHVVRPDGKYIYFKKTNNVWTADADVREKLVQLTDANAQLTGWKFTDEDDAVELYDAKGLLLSITARNGQVQKMTRSTAATPASIAPGIGYLIQVTDHFGHQLSFTWNSDGTLKTMRNGLGGVYTYGYDSDKRLTTVQYPVLSGTPDTRTYVYGETEHTAGVDDGHLLTGVIDENGKRTATYDYDSTGRGIGTQHAGGADKFTLSYGTNQTLVTDARATQRSYNFVKVLGAPRLTSVSQPGGAGCAAAANAIQYDGNGNVKSRRDFNGNTTNYTYDLARNLELTRTEAVGKPEQRLITTEWHPQFRLPARIAEPNRRTTYTYYANGDVKSVTLQATTDVSGAQGFAATLSGLPRTTSYTYNANGQTETVTGPRAGGIDKTTYAYDPVNGNLLTMTNALSQQTQFGEYTATGQIGMFKDPNGQITRVSYTPRGMLATRSETDGQNTLTTRYDYDPVGLLHVMTLPDQSSATFTYDDAHRLTDITDSLGNKIHYQLDDMGNRYEETVKDPQAVLSRQITRHYDALNRLQTLTGATK